MKNVRKMSYNELDFARKDLMQVIGIQEQTARDIGPHMVPKLGQYHDDLHAVIGELIRRRDR